MDHKYKYTCFCPASISSQVPGTTKVIILKIALHLFLHLLLVPLTPLGLRDSGIFLRSQTSGVFFSWKDFALCLDL